MDQYQEYIIKEIRIQTELAEESLKDKNYNMYSTHMDTAFAFEKALKNYEKFLDNNEAYLF